MGSVCGFRPLGRDGSLLSFLLGEESRVGLDTAWREMVSCGRHLGLWMLPEERAGLLC